MPSYAFLATQRVDFSRTPDKLAAMKTVGVPYADSDIRSAGEVARVQAQAIAKELGESGTKTEAETEVVALTAYLQRLGQAAPPPPPNAGVAHAMKEVK